MDHDTRVAVRRQIDSTMRKRLGLPQVVRASTTQRQSTGKTWTDDEIQAALRKVSELSGEPLDKLTLATYCRIRDANPHLGPTRKILRQRGVKLLTRGQK